MSAFPLTAKYDNPEWMRDNALGQDSVFRLERRDGRPSLVDDAYALMTKNAAGLTTRDVTLGDVQVSAANCRFSYLDDHVRRRCDFRFWTLLQGFLRRTQINESFHR